MDWVSVLTPIGAVIAGGLVAVVTGMLAERRQRRAAREEFDQHEQAVYTGVFVVRNFIAERINAYDPSRKWSDPRDLLDLETAQRALDRLIEKTRPSGEALLLVLFELSLRLDDLLAAAMRGETDRRVVAGKMDAVAGALEQFDLVAEASSLGFISEGALQEMMARQPEASPGS